MTFGDETGDENIVLRLYINHTLSKLLLQFSDFKYFKSNNIKYIILCLYKTPVRVIFRSILQNLTE